MRVLINITQQSNANNWHIFLSKDIEINRFEFCVYFNKNNISLLNYSHNTFSLDETRHALSHWLSGTSVDEPLSKEFREALIEFLIKMLA